MQADESRYFFDIKIRDTFDDHFGSFIKDLYDTVDERVILNKAFLETTNKYLYDLLLEEVRCSILIELGRWEEYYATNGKVTYEFTSTKMEEKNYITISEARIIANVIHVFIVPQILLGYFKHDKDIITNDWKNDVIELKHNSPQKLHRSKRQLTTKESLLEEYKSLIPSGKSIVTEKDMAELAGISRTTFQSRCRANGFKWERKQKCFVDLVNEEPI